MVKAGMRRYKVRSSAQAALVGPVGTDRLDLDELFGDDRHDARLEIGCGHGEFISQMAELHPDERFVGVEQDHLRITKTAHKALKLGATNMRLFSGDAHAFVRDRLPDAAFRRVYILFPDPWPKPSHRRRRLMNRAFLREISRVTAPGGRLIIGSDTHNYAFQALSNLTTLPNLWRNLYPGGYRFDIPTRFPTVFERHKKEEGCTICYLMLERTAEPAPPAPPRIPTTGDTEADDD
jgi:tRNA (guanine-N7-)-methyltransferase